MRPAASSCSDHACRSLYHLNPAYYALCHSAVNCLVPACQVDVELVSSVGDEVYLALDKGPITPQHALIIPIEHHPSLAALPAEAAKEVGRCVFCVHARLYACLCQEAVTWLLCGHPTARYCMRVRQQPSGTWDRPLTLYCVCVCVSLSPSLFACRYLSALRTAAASAGQQLVGFERYLRLRSKGGNHTHINTLPISKCCCGLWLCLVVICALRLQGVSVRLAAHHGGACRTM